MILMRITDFLRSIRFLVINGYPEQACTLASSIFENEIYALRIPGHYAKEACRIVTENFINSN